MITLKTNYGEIKIELDQENTPITLENFLDYAQSGFYDGTIFHRVIDHFMIQGGGFQSGMKEKKPNQPIVNEAESAMPNKRGTVAMARLPDPHSASAQFFINVKDNDFLNFRNKSHEGYGYCVFARVVEGMDVIDKIKAVPTGSKAGHQDVPIEDVIIEKIFIDQ